MGLAGLPLVGEVVAIILPALAQVTALIGVVLAWRSGGRPRTGPIAAASLSLVLLAATLVPWLPQPSRPVQTGSSLTIVSANIAGAAGRAGVDTAQRLLAIDADIVVTTETSHRTLSDLAAVYAHSLQGGLRDVSVFSRHPLTRVSGAAVDPGARVEVVEVGAPEPFVLVAAHLPRPWVTTGGLRGQEVALSGRRYQATPLRQARIIDEVVQLTATLEGPIVLAGDLNISDRGPGYARLRASFDDAAAGSWALPTSIKPIFAPLLLRIDHVMTAGGWCAQGYGHITLPRSDHRGLMAEVGPCA